MRIKIRDLYIFTLLSLLVVFFPVNSFSADRSHTVQSKAYSALSSILEKSDFILVVNRVDQLEDSSSSAPMDGYTKKLPGLDLGIDSKGNLIRDNKGAQSYNGPVSVKLIIDKSVNESTIKTIRKMLPELMGGVQDDDELAVETATLRQLRRDNSSAPQIQIQNKFPENNKTDMQEYFKYFSLLMIASGIFFWIVAMLINRTQNKTGEGSKAIDGLRRPENKSASGQPENQTAPKLFDHYSTASLSLFFLRAFKKKKDLIYFKYWIQNVSFQKKKELYASLPTWILEFFQTQEKVIENEEAVEISTAEFENKLLILERDCKNESFYRKAFLSWFPAEALRFVPQKMQKSLSESSKRVLAQLRPDLGNLVVSKNGDDYFGSEEYQTFELNSCFEELIVWTSKSNDLENISDTLDAYLLRYRSTIDYLTEFSPIEVQLKQAERVLSKDQYNVLYKSSPHVNFPSTLNESELKDWLRLVDPNDFAWWTTQVTTQIEYKNYLRPLKLSMFNTSLNEKIYLGWNENAKKMSNQRLIESFRSILYAREGRRNEAS